MRMVAEVLKVCPCGAPAFKMLMSRWCDELYMEMGCDMHAFMMCEEAAAIISVNFADRLLVLYMELV